MNIGPLLFYCNPAFGCHILIDFDKLSFFIDNKILSYLRTRVKGDAK